MEYKAVFIMSLVMVITMILLLVNESTDNPVSLQVIVINLTRRPDRLDYIRKSLAVLSIPYIRFSAIDSHKLLDSDYKTVCTGYAYAQIQKNHRTEDKQLSKGAVGCALSHIAVWKQINRPTLILEDDIDIKHTIPEMQTLIKSAPRDWDILLLGWAKPQDGREIFSRNNTKNATWIQLVGFWGLHAYIIKSSTVKKLLDDVLPLTYQIDTWISDKATEGKIKVYGLRKTIINQRHDIFFTDIQTPLIKNNQLVPFL